MLGPPSPGRRIECRLFQYSAQISSKEVGGGGGQEKQPSKAAEGPDPQSSRG